MEGILGQITYWAGKYAPKGWAFCHGQTLDIQQNSALFSLLGSIYGGNGQTTFALPNLQGQILTGVGQGLGLPNKGLGEKKGADSTTLTADNIPAHNHAFMASEAPAKLASPAGNYLAVTTKNDKDYLNTGTATTLAANAIGVNTGSTTPPAPVDVRQASVGINFIICLQGMYPARP